MHAGTNTKRSLKTMYKFAYFIKTIVGTIHELSKIKTEDELWRLGLVMLR